MRLNCLTTCEATVSTARGEIVDVVNRLAGRVAATISRSGIAKPRIDHADGPSTPAVVYAEFGAGGVSTNPKTLTVTVYSEREFKVEMPIELSRMAGSPNYQRLKSVNEVNRMLRGAIQNFTKTVANGVPTGLMS